MFSKKIRIPFHLSDPAQIMFFGSFYEIYHQFLEEHLEDLGVNWEDWFKGETACPIRGLKTSYDAPLKSGEFYTMKLSVSRIGNSSVSFKFEALSDQGLHATTEVTHCFVSKSSRTKVAVPSKIKSALLKHLED